jgi:hypothetical protein
LNVIRIILAITSFLCFVTFSFLFAARSEVLLSVYKGYVEWLKQANTPVVVPLFLLLSAGSSQIIVTILSSIQNAEVQSRSIYWGSFVVSFSLQIAGWLLNR